MLQTVSVFHNYKSDISMFLFNVLGRMVGSMKAAGLTASSTATELTQTKRASQREESGKTQRDSNGSLTPVLTSETTLIAYTLIKKTH